jgi:hypothetical protein
MLFIDTELINDCVYAMFNRSGMLYLRIQAMVNSKDKNVTKYYN